MSVTLMFLCRRSTRHSLTLFRPLQSPSLTNLCNFSTLKSKYASIKPSTPTSNPFRQPTDDKSRRLRLQEQMAFREKYQIDGDMELIYTIQRYRLFSFMHFLCTIATVSIGSFMIMYYYRDYFDISAFTTNQDKNIPEWSIYAVGSLVYIMFGSLLVFIARMPTRVYHSITRRSYTLFYHPMISVLRQKKLVFNDNQYKLIAQKLDNHSGPERAVKIRVALGNSWTSSKRDFYLVEAFFRSRKDLRQLRTHQIEMDEPKGAKVEDEGDIWETVVENQERTTSSPNSSRRTFMR